MLPNTLNEQFTLVIMTYNRYPFLLRLLSFYESYGFPFPIIVLDSSSDTLDIKELPPLLENEKIVYQHFDPEIFFVDKVAQGVQQVNTPYAALCADDDYLIPGAVPQCLEFLESSPDYSCVQGMFISHFIHSNGLYWIPVYQGTVSNEADQADERLRAFLVKGGGMGGTQVFAIHRSDVLKTIWQISSEYVSDWGLSEIVPASLSLVYGKRKILPVFYSSREPNDYSWYDHNYLQKMYSSEKCEKAIQGITKQLEMMSNLDHQAAEASVRNSVEGHLHLSGAKKTTDHPVTPKKPVTKLQKLQNRIKNRWTKWSYSKIFANKGSLFYEDYLKLEHSVLKANIDSEILNRSRQEYQRN